VRFEAVDGALNIIPPRASVTFFANAAGSSKRELTLSDAELAATIERESAPQKSALPWLKLATFGEKQTDKGSLRHDANVLAVHGIEADYDGEAMSFAEAVEKLTKAGIRAIVYTSPSHTPMRPRWRVLCFLSAPCAPAKRTHYLGRLNGLFGGMFAAESWALSQSYYFGRVRDNPNHAVEVVEGQPLDLCDELDEIWQGKPHTNGREASATQSGPLNDSELLADIREGRNYHGSMVRLAGKWAMAGVPLMEARRRLIDAMHAVFPPDRDARWQRRFDDTDNVLLYVYGKEADKKVDPESPRPKLRLLSVADCAAAKPRRYIVKGIIAAGDLVLVIGPPGAGKSALVPLMTYAVALGRPVFGRPVQAGKVLYVAAEDAHGMPGRVHALKRRYGDAGDFFLVDGATDLFSPEGEAEELRALVRREKPAVVVIDTLAAAFPGMRENESQDMGAAITLARSFGRDDGDTPGPAVILLHHVPKGDESTPRGHGILNGDADVVLRLARGIDSGTVTVSFGKNRNGPSFGVQMAFAIETEVIGSDEDGDDITAPVAVESGAPRRLGPRLTAAERKAVGFLADVLNEQGKPLPLGPGFAANLNGTDEAVWRHACEDRRLSTAETSKDRARAFRATYKNLLAKGMVAANAGWVWLPRPEREGDDT
jgi:hypothetical protein